MEKEIVFGTLGKGSLSLLVIISTRQMIIGVGYENWLDWGPALMLYIGPIKIGIGRDNGSGW